MTIQTYSPGEVDLYIALIYQVEDYSPDSLLSISKDEDYFTTNKGATGGVERIHKSDKTYTLELSLSQTSPTNTVLNALATLDHFSKRGIFPIFAKDNSGQSIFMASSCWIESPAEASYTGSVETRVWRIRCADMLWGIAGNESDRSIIDQVGQLGTLITQAGGNLGLF